MSAGKHNTSFSDPVAGDNLPQRREARVGLKGWRGRAHTVAERLAARTVKQPSGCWEVSGWALPSGHVQIKRKSEGLPAIRAHRLAWELVKGPVPDGLNVLHKCDNPRCVNVDHLFLGTQRDNVLDSIRKGRYNAFGRQKLDAAKVQMIRLLFAQGLTHKAIAQRFGVARHTVTGILNGKSWAHLPFAPSVESIDAGAELLYHANHVPDESSDTEHIHG